MCEVAGVRAADIGTAHWTLTCHQQTTPGPGGLIDNHTKGTTARPIPVIEPLRPLIAGQLRATRGDPGARPYRDPRRGRISTAVLRDATRWDDVASATA
ncbi:hypothetical protein [Kitasatospora sp. NPDC017646]|uniref:hypothetical protein n=1 Tax=Kitasatospora sp. NPDC017646 TaxID=3364024 RepID=UPI0037AD17A1